MRGLYLCNIMSYYFWLVRILGFGLSHQVSDPYSALLGRLTTIKSLVSLLVLPLRGLGLLTFVVDMISPILALGETISLFAQWFKVST